MQTEKLNAPPNTVGAYYARTHFSALAERVKKGEIITITRHGRPVAVMRPAQKITSAEKQEVMAESRKQGESDYGG